MSILFSATQEIVRESERQVANLGRFNVGNFQFIAFDLNKIWKPLGQLFRILAMPVVMLQRGLSDLFKPMQTWMIATVIWFGVIWLISPMFDPTQEAKQSLTTLAVAIPFITSVFAVPSTYAFAPFSEREISELSTFIRNLRIDTESKLDALAESIENTEDRAAMRTNALKWAIASTWALFLYLLNQAISIAIKTPGEDVQKLMNDNFSMLITAIFFALVSVAIVIGFKKSNDAVFRRIRYAISELRFQLAQEDTSQIKINNAEMQATDSPFFLPVAEKPI